ncbi:hypothetical protein K504DRAFT_454493 [Pleomassaria siparia CBS 279.74]|uniref:Uncharacterized protein n=1 Tax=Pleomassaria siparia CBS 279.74 TaxID=1314801 RepID=A0A6G1KCJ5_9PLEO|nr:hypothetical protein K504DRAFT_454493 [Pleomassaria siparia CBS 279.74]
MTLGPWRRAHGGELIPFGPKIWGQSCALTTVTAPVVPIPSLHRSHPIPSHPIPSIPCQSCFSLSTPGPADSPRSISGLLRQWQRGALASCQCGCPRSLGLDERMQGRHATSPMLSSDADRGGVKLDLGSQSSCPTGSHYPSLDFMQYKITTVPTSTQNFTYMYIQGWQAWYGITAEGCICLFPVGHAAVERGQETLRCTLSVELSSRAPALRGNMPSSAVFGGHDSGSLGDVSLAMMTPIAAVVGLSSVHYNGGSFGSSSSQAW